MQLKVLEEQRQLREGDLRLMKQSRHEVLKEFQNEFGKFPDKEKKKYVFILANWPFPEIICQLILSIWL